MKYIIVSDTHLGIKQGSPLYHEVTQSLFGHIFQYAEDNKINQLIHAGDFFDNRKSIPIKTILVALDIADMCDRVMKDTYIITGNHDTIYKDDIESSLLSMFSEYKGITIVNQPLALGNILLLPWLFDIRALENSENRFDVCIGHFEMNGVAMNEAGSVMESATLNRGDFNNFKLVLSGHYHTPGKYGNIQYLGSPYHMSFSDVDGERGFYVLDDEKLTLEFIKFDDYPKFRRVKDTDVTATDRHLKDSYVKGNIVELIFTKDHGISGNLAIVEKIKNMEPLTLTPKYVSIDSSMSQDDINVDDIELKDALGMLKEYYEQSEQPEHIDIKMLNKITEIIYKETTDG